MNFDKMNYLLIALAFVAILSACLFKYEKLFFAKVRKYWFLHKTKSRKISLLLYVISFLILGISLGDLRGREVSIESNIPFQKTLILIDTSQSMLVEDIRPNRIGKASLIARHFIKNSFGHQVALSVFSDIQKKIVPFTDDIEILESRLQTLLTSTPEGGSNIGLALKEGAQFFKTKSGHAPGNILLITDGEEHDLTKIELPESINLAVVAVGSEKGGKIPIRSRNGTLSRFKKFNSEEVVSKINKPFFENIITSVSSAKVWYAKSYSLPTTDILKFFENSHKNAFSKGSMKQKPVKGYFIIILAIITYVVSIFLSRFKSFTAVLSLLLIFSFNTRADELKGLMDKFKKGEITKKEKLRVAELLMKGKKPEKASKLYSQTLKRLDEESTNDLFNYGTSLLKSKKIKEGIELYKYLHDERELSPEMEEIVTHLLLHII